MALEQKMHKNIDLQAEPLFVFIPNNYLLKKYLGPNETPSHNTLAYNIDNELCLVEGRDIDQDPQFWLLTPNILAVLGYTGLVQKVYEIGGGKKEEILTRDNYGNFSSEGTKTVKQIIDEVYTNLKKLRFQTPRGFETPKEYLNSDGTNLFDKESSDVLGWFGELQKFYTASEIIPDITDEKIYFPLSAGCQKHCSYCPYAGSKFNAYKIDVIQSYMDEIRAIEEKYFKGFTNRIFKGFLTTSDILQFYKSGGDPKEVLRIAKNKFPEVLKWESFMGIENILKVDESYLVELKKSGLAKVYVGIESAHNEQSAFVGKKETFEDKLKAVEKIKRAGFQIELIVQGGLTGESFFINDKWYNSKECLDTTVKFLIMVAKNEPKVKVTLSKYTPISGTLLARQHKNSINLVPFTDNAGKKLEVKILEKKLIQNYVNVETGYEEALRRRVWSLAA